MGYITLNCWSPGVGELSNGASEGVNERSISVSRGDMPSTDFPGVNNISICRLLRGNDPREKTLPNGMVVKWCLECGS